MVFSQQTPTVSVIIPTFNREHIVTEAIDCVRNQSLDKLEIFVVDDGSTDETYKRIQDISEPRLNYRYKENGGHASAVNLALPHTKGEYIAFLDADDLWENNYLEQMVGALQENRSYGLAYSNFLLKRFSGGTDNLSLSERCPSGRITKEFLQRSLAIYPSGTVISRCNGALLFWDEALKYSTDFDFFLRASTQTSFLHVKRAKVIKREYKDSVSYGKKPGGPLEAGLIFERFYQFFRNNYSTKMIFRKKIRRRFTKAAKRAKDIGDKDLAAALFRKVSQYQYIPVTAMRALPRLITSTEFNSRVNLTAPLAPAVSANGKHRDMLSRADEMYGS